jgi:PEP-CTERM motif
MCSRKASRIALIALSISAISAVNLHASSCTIPVLSNESSLTFTTFDISTGTPITINVPAPSSINIEIDGNNGSFTFFVSGNGSPLWPGFDGNYSTQAFISAPPPGGGLDAISIQGFDLLDGATGGLTILAPNGSLSSSTCLPDSLAAFQDYAQTHSDAGTFSFGTPIFDGNQYYGGVAIVTLGSVPEPSSLGLLSIGISFGIGIAASRRRTKPAQTRPNGGTEAVA